MPAERSESKPSVNKNTLLLITLVASFLNPFMIVAVNIGLPRIGNELSMGAVALSWVSMAFLLSSAVCLIPVGRLADMTGRKRMFIQGNFVIAVSSTLCAFSPSGTALIAFRIFQGIGSAMVYGTIMAIITSAFAPAERGKIIGINVTAVYIAVSAAPVLGGIITQTMGWRSLFFMTVPVALFTIAATHLYVKTEWKGKPGKGFDYRGATLYIVSMSVFMSGFSKMPDPFAVTAAVLGFLGLVAFVRLELSLDSPVIHMELFRDNRLFAFSNLAAMINYAATFAVTFILSLYLQYVKGFSPQDAGLVLITQPVVMAVIGPFAGRMSDRNDPRILSTIGMGITAVGLLPFIFVNGATGTATIMASLAVLGIGFGIFVSPNTSAIMGSVGNAHIGTASASVATMRTTGQVISMGVATLVIHIFIGTAKIVPGNMHLFIDSTRIIFAIFMVLCALGVFASLARGKQTPANR